MQPNIHPSGTPGPLQLAEKPHHSAEVFHASLTPLHLETRSVLPTNEAAAQMGRQPQTLRTWACFENGPIRPIRINGRLAWKVSDIRRVLGVTT